MSEGPVRIGTPILEEKQHYKYPNIYIHLKVDR